MASAPSDGSRLTGADPHTKKYSACDTASCGIGITHREHEILGLIAQGLSNREIGEKLFVSENTVKTHSSRLFEKMIVNRRVQAVQKAKDLGLIP